MVVTSGGFDPLHVGHLRCLQETAKIAASHKTLWPSKVVVIVNGDGFLVRKKGQPFMPHRERMQIVDAIQGVDFVVGWDDGSQTVCGAIEILHPDIFTKGGDRDDPDKIPEWQICQKLGCRVEFGVGGGKVQSSSDLIAGRAQRLSKCSRWIDKPWGGEEIVIETDRYVAKVLEISSGHQLSRQYHNVKDETLLVMEGVLEADIGMPEDEDTRILRPGDLLRVPPGTIHRFRHGGGNLRLLEVSTPELDDVVRLEDDYDRA